MTNDKIVFVPYGEYIERMARLYASNVRDCYRQGIIPLSWEHMEEEFYLQELPKRLIGSENSLIPMTKDEFEKSNRGDS